MKKGKLILFVIIIAIIGIGGYFGYQYWYDTTHFFTTNNASVTADTVTITPLMTGNVVAWNVKEGDDVVAGQILGRQDLENLVQSSAMNAQSLDQIASSTVSRADIKTPIAGKVVQSNVIIGETVAPSMQVATIADTNNMYVVANVEETDINRIKVGQPVVVDIDAYPNKTFTGYVENIGEATQSAFSLFPSLNTSGTFTKVTQLIPVKINVAGIENVKLRMGYNATVKIKTN